MSIPCRTPRRRTLLLVGFFAVAAILTVASFGAAGARSNVVRNDPKIAANKSYGELNGNNLGDDCWAHHRVDGMWDTFVVYPLAPRQFKVGEAADLPVQIINPWKSELRDISLDVTLLGASVVTIVADRTTQNGPASDAHLEKTDLLGPIENTLAPRAPGTPPHGVLIPVKLPLGAKYLIASVELVPRGGLPRNPDGYMVNWHPLPAKNESGPYFTANGSASNTNFGQEYNLTRNLTTPIAGGESAFYIDHQNGYAQETRFFLNATIVMQGGSTGKTYSVPVAASMKVPKGGSVTVPIHVLPFAKGTQTLEIHVRAATYYKHNSATPDIDHFNRIARLDQADDYVTSSSMIPQRTLTVGDSFIPSANAPAMVAVPSTPWQLVVGETTGIAAAALLVPSLVLGGTYGKASRRFLNMILGGAKRRVMFHNLMSLGLSLVAFGHILLFTNEVRYTILMGILWGGLGALSLLVLGLTGYYQVPLIQRHGYGWWRMVHLVTGLLVVLFIGWHMVADGTDFHFIKERLPTWINQLNLAQK